jgi:2-dehydro-3-deoxy-L-rhamnonate dehydrogenase (NAD+)
MANSYDLKGRFAIVTGGAKGIGKAVAELLMSSGAEVIIWDRYPADLAGARSAMVDITRAEAIDASLAALGSGQRIDILVNCAGYLGPATQFLAHAAGEWRRIIDVNLAGTLQVTQAVLPRMLKQRSGRIVNLASLAGKEGLPGLVAYSAASAGVISFSKALSREIAKDNVLVNCVAPGPIDTDMIRDLGASVVERMVQDSPLGRLGEPAEVAQLVAWLCSDAGSFNTGAVFDMSGGRARY